MKRRTWLAITGGVLFVGAMGTLLLFRLTEPPLRFTEETWHKMWVPMSEAEATAALELPAGDYRTEPSNEFVSWLLRNEEKFFQENVAERHVVRTWIGDHGAIFAMFNEDGKLVYYRRVEYAGPTFFQRCGHRLGF